MSRRKHQQYMGHQLEEAYLVPWLCLKELEQVPWTYWEGLVWVLWMYLVVLVWEPWTYWVEKELDQKEEMGLKDHLHLHNHK